jgi:hypothetical protein
MGGFMKKLNLLLIFVVALLSCAMPAKAELITIAISGHVTAVNDMYSNLNSQINIGDAITGTYTYDSAIADAAPSPESGLYYNAGNPCGISLYIDGFDFKTDPTNVDFLVSIGNWATGDKTYVLRSYNNLPLSSGDPIVHILWQLNDSTGTALSSDDLPLTAPDLSKWNVNGLTIDIARGGTGTIQGIITSAVLVPEPCSILLFLAGGIVFRRQKRTR